MGNSHNQSTHNRHQEQHKQPRRDGQAYTSQFSLSQFIGNLSGRSFLSVASNQSVYSASRPWSRVSRRRWNEATLKNPLDASKTAWPVARKESSFLPEFPITTELLQRDFEIINTIAKGAFGEVYKVRKISIHKEYALKVLKKSQVVSENAVRQVKEEARIQEACGHHTFIVGAVARWQTKKRLYIVSEYIPGGELLALLDAYGKLPEDLVKIFVAEIALAIDFLHNAGVIYRDLKPENILLDCGLHAQLTDFGLSKWLSFGARTATLCGTLHYMAPEVLSGEPYGHAVDWWSLGVVACRMLTNEVDIFKNYYVQNGFMTIICAGNFPNVFFNELRMMNTTMVNINTKEVDNEIETVIAFRPNTIFVKASDFEEFEQILKKLTSTPYWHPHANLILHFEMKMDSLLVSRIFFIFWYQKILNAIIIECGGSSEIVSIHTYNPYVYENFTLQFNNGCYTVKRITLPVQSYKNDVTCEDNCENVTLYSKIRSDKLGTCIGHDVVQVKIGDFKIFKKLNLFEDKTKNLHGVPLRAYATEVLPFTGIQENADGTYTLQNRDGIIWNTLMDIMNFTIDLSPSKNVMKQKFNYEVNMQQVSFYSRRKADLLLTPIYLVDFVVVELDLTYPYKDSGVCIMSHRAGFQNILFDVKLLENNFITVLKFIICFLASWMTFFIFNCIEKEKISFDQMGKDFVNTIRNVLNISLHLPPKRSIFRIFLVTSIWGFFIMNFVTQAAIVSFFTASKRNKDVETFDDIIEKDYSIEGIASPDVVLPDTEEKFNKINSKLVAIHDFFECVSRMENDSHRFCLIDCAVGRYLERNKLNSKGEQYLHIATDRIHSHYLNLVFPKNSHFTSRVNKYMMALVEGGFIRKWEDYRFNDIKEEAEVKPLSMNDLVGIFNCYLLLVTFSSLAFVAEILLQVILWAKQKCCKTIKINHCCYS